MTIRRTPRIAPALATMFAVCILGASSLASAEDTDPQWSVDSGKRKHDPLRAVDPNRAPKAEDFVADEQEQSIDEQLAAPQQKQVPSVESRYPKIDLPKDITQQPQQNPQWMPKSPLVQINKSGLKPQVLKKPTGGGSIKGMGITFNTSLQTGASSMSVPIAMPPGRRGLAPGLTLGYSSGGGQGICGQGWSVGVGFIARQTDQVLPSYDEYDRFVYNGGQELVRVASFGAAPSLLAGQDYWIYRSKIEGLFWRFFRVNPPGSNSLVPEHWVAQDRNGTLYYFGDIAEARVQDANDERTFRWSLTLVKDVHNNQVEYEWTEYVDSAGQTYLTGVYYNNHPTAQKFQHRIELEYELRDDVLTTYQAGYEVRTARRLVNIWVWTDYGGGGASPSNRHIEPNDGPGTGFRWLVRRYAFDYKADRYHSLLDSITLIGNDNNELNALPPARFHYQEVDDRNGATSTVQVPDFGELNTEVRFLNNSPDGSVGTGLTEIMDIDGDGLVDVLRIDPTSYGDDYHRYILGYGDVDAAGFITPALDPQQTIDMGTAGDLISRGNHQRLTNSNVQIMDVDGDGAVEMIHMPRMGTYEIYELECDSTLGVGAPYNPTKCSWELYATVNGHPTIDLTTDAEEIKLIDVNGDSLTDVVRTAGTRIEHWLNLGRFRDSATQQSGEGRFGSVNADGTLSDDPIVSCQLFKGTFIRFSDPRVKLADMNGDGLQDIVVVDFGQVAYWPNKGWGNWGVGAHCDENQIGSNRHISMSNPPFMSGFDAAEIRLGDVNGDGLADMVRIRNLVVDVWLNRGGTYSPRVMIDPAPFSTGFSNRVRLADVNGSGSRDILWGDAGEYSYIDLTGGIKPRLLIKMENGLGATTEIEYETSVAQYLRSREEGDEWFSTCPYPSHVVRKVTTKDNFDAPALASAGWPAGVYEKNYRYYDCVWDGKEHESRGFSETVVETVGDANSPTSYTRHRFYQGVPANGVQNVDEALAGQAYRVDTWGLDANQAPVYLSTAWTSYAVRTVDAAPHQDDNQPGLDEYFHRSVRFSYAAESHSFGYNTTNWQAGTYTPSGILAIRTEGPGGTVDQTHTASIPLPATQATTVHVKSDSQVDDLAQVTRSRAFGQVDKQPLPDDPVIEKHAIYAKKESAWIHRVCESWVAEGTATYNRKLQHYDGRTSTWSGGACAPAHPSPGGTAGCEIGDHGLSTKGTFEICYTPLDAPAEQGEIEEHVTEFTSFGLPTHTKALKKLEGWVYYEDPRGYQALPTREVIRVGLNQAIPDYDPTPVKYLTTRVSYDPGFGQISEYRDENDQKSMAVYDHLGRLTELWGPREPKATNCSSGGNPTFMRAASVEYHVTSDPAAQPYSFVKATTFEDACDPTDVKEAWSFADGLGRVRMTIGPGDNQGELIASGYVVYDQKGAGRFAYGPAFLNQPGQPSFAPGTPVLPGPVQADCASDETTHRNTVCVTETSYDAFARAIETTQPNGVKTQVQFHGPLVTVAYDGNDVQTNPYSNPAFHNTPTTSTKDGHGRLAEVMQMYVNPDKGLTGRYFKSYAYDTLGNLVEFNECKGDSVANSSFGDCDAAHGSITKRQHFDTVGRRRAIEDPDAGVWKFVFDESGNITQTTDGKHNASAGATGNLIGYDYDDANRLIVERCVQCERRPAGDILARYFYDSPQSKHSGRGYMSLPDTTGPGDDEPQDWVLGRLTRIEDDTGWVMFSYDRLGRQVTEAQHIEGRILNGVDDPDPNDGIEVIDVLDGNDDIIEGNDLVYIGRVEHDDAGRISRLVYPAPTGPAPSGGDIDPLEVYYEYNLRGLTSKIKGPDPLDSGEYTYLIVSASDPYNAMGQRMDYQYGDASQIQHSKRYDRNGRLRSATATQDATHGNTELHSKAYTYDAASNIIEIHDNRNYAQVSAYTGGNNLPYHLFINHDSLYRVIEVEYRRTVAENAAIEAQNPAGTPYTTYRRKMIFNYSAVGNLTERTTWRGSTTGNGTENPPEEFYEKWLGPVITPATGPAHATDHPHAFGAASPTTVNAAVSATYDANGNMLTLTVTNDDDPNNLRYEHFEYTWNHYDQLIKVEKLTSLGGAPVAILYGAYDSSGQRVIKTEDSDGTGSNKNTLYVTDGVELRNDKYIRYVTDGTQKIARISLTKPYNEPLPSTEETRLLYVADHLGSTSAVVMDHDDQSQNGDERGCVVSTTSHLPYGGIEAETGAIECGLQIEDWRRFTGKELEKPFGLQYFGSRWMNPSIGVFLSVDPDALFSSGEEHSYLYVNGRVLNKIDPGGEYSVEYITKWVKANPKQALKYYKRFIGVVSGAVQSEINSAKAILRETFDDIKNVDRNYTRARNAAGMAWVYFHQGKHKKAFESYMEHRRYGDKVANVAALAFAAGSSSYKGLSAARSRLSGMGTAFLRRFSGTKSLKLPKWSRSRLDSIRKMYKSFVNRTLKGAPKGSGSTSKARFEVTPDGVAIPRKPGELKSVLSKMQDTSTNPATSRKFVGEGSAGPVRVRVEKAHPTKPNFQGTPDPLHTVDHLHVDRRKNVTSGGWSSKEKVQFDWPF